MKLRNLILLSILMVSLGTVTAQQDAMYTQHSFNKLPINPAYAGSRDAISVVALYRNQWTGMPGAPRTCQFNMHAPLRNKKLALGINAISDRHGITSETGVWGQFAYRIPTRDGMLSMGISAGLSNYRIALATATSAVDFDPSLASDVNQIMPNAGFGIYYYSERYYAGVSIPHLINNGFSSTPNADGEIGAQQYRHYYAMGGYVLDMGRNLKLRPTVLLRYVPNAPFQADLGASILISERVWVGAQYRTRGSVDFSTEFQLSDWMRIGYAYDLQTNALATSSGGSHEIMVAFDFDTRNKRGPKRGSIKCFF